MCLPQHSSQSSSTLDCARITLISLAQTTCRPGWHRERIAFGVPYVYFQSKCVSPNQVWIHKNCRDERKIAHIGWLRAENTMLLSAPNLQSGPGEPLVLTQSTNLSTLSLRDVGLLAVHSQDL
jgi:hypothetical protein